MAVFSANEIRTFSLDICELVTGTDIKKLDIPLIFLYTFSGM